MYENLRPDNLRSFPFIYLSNCSMSWNFAHFSSIFYFSGSQVYIDDVAIHVKSDGSLDETKTDLYIHCIENGTNQVMDVNEILTSLDNNRESIDQLWSQNKVSQARTLIQEKEDDNSRTLLITLLSILGALALILLFFGLIYYVCK